MAKKKVEKVEEFAEISESAVQELKARVAKLEAALEQKDAIHKALVQTLKDKNAQLSTKGKDAAKGTKKIPSYNY